MNERIILNQIKTPDGTILTSRHRHDYKTYVDKNGKEYMVDGGLDYLRRNVQDEVYEEQSIYTDSPFELIREYFEWGSYGKNQDEPLHWIKLKDMEDDHIINILKISKLLEIYKEIFIKELKFRKVYEEVTDEWEKNNLFL